MLRRVKALAARRGTGYQTLIKEFIAARFAELRVDEELGTIVWPNGADVDPDVLYGTAVPAWKDEPQVS